MIKMLFMSKLSPKVVIKKHNHVPRLGDRVDLFYHPTPKVVDIITFPSDETLLQFQAGVGDIDVILILE